MRVGEVSNFLQPPPPTFVPNAFDRRPIPPFPYNSFHLKTHRQSTNYLDEFGRVPNRGGDTLPRKEDKTFYAGLHRGFHLPPAVISRVFHFGVSIANAVRHGRVSLEYPSGLVLFVLLASVHLTDNVDHRAPRARARSRPPPLLAPRCSRSR
jgi:hypothetical protein